LALKWTTDVRFDPEPAMRRWSRKGRGKRLKVDWMPMNDELLRAMRALPSRGRSVWCFPNACGTGPIDAKNWYRRVFKPAVDAAGLVDFHFHDLKHTTGTRLGERGADVDDIRIALQHSDVRMAMRYSHHARGRRRATMALLARPDRILTDPRTDPEAPRLDEADEAPSKTATIAGR